MTGRRVLLYVQHLLGIGHLKRSATLADAMTRAGLDVTFVTGGHEVPGIAINAAHVVQLPAAGAADMSFKAILDARGDPVDERWMQQRRELLLAAWRESDPHVLLIELFPFGRRQMRFELQPLLDAASRSEHRPVIVSSVRDVLGGGQKDPARQDQMLELFERYFDHLLVHGDPALIPFERTFRHRSRIGSRLHYTGYVVDRRPQRSPAGGPGRDEVIVSVGGGAVGRQLLETAMRARPLSRLAGHRWRLLAGSNVSEADLAALLQLAGAAQDGGVTVERNRPDFAQLLEHCRLSVSQGGYNTIMEVLQSGARPVVVPFSGAGETEQALRARLLEERGWVDIVDESQLNPDTLAAAVDRAALRPPIERAALCLDGAQRSAELLAGWAARVPW